MALAIVVGVGTAATGYAMDASAGFAVVPLGPGRVHVEIGIEHSRFSIGHLQVQEGTLVEFVVVNDDPIAHELIVGDAEVQTGPTRTGTELRHPPVPGEVSVGEAATGASPLRQLRRAGHRRVRLPPPRPRRLRHGGRDRGCPEQLNKNLFFF